MKERDRRDDEEELPPLGQPPGEADPNQSDDFAAEHTDTDVSPCDRGGPEPRKVPHRHAPSTDEDPGPVV